MLLSSAGAFSQETCGFIENSDFVDRLKFNKKHVSEFRDNDLYVPIAFHVIGKDDGSGIPNYTNAFRSLCFLNEVYGDFGIHFYLFNNTIDTIYNSDVFNDDWNNDSYFTSKKTFGCINIFIVNAITASGTGTILGYYTPWSDYIVIRKSKYGNESKTLPHELGHFFSLPHTFRGWDHEPWSENLHGSPVFSQYSPDGILNELVSGDNCNFAGDLICDTPADYNLGFGYSGECNQYNGNCKDITGELLAPAEDNFMSYFFTCQDYIFSQQQQNIIKSDLENRIANGSMYSQNSPEVFNSDNFELVYPVDITTEYSTSIDFLWNDVDSDDVLYLFQLSRLPDFSYQPVLIITDDTSYTVSGLTPGKKYYWSVVPFNKFSTCDNVGAKTFHTGDLTDIVNIDSDFELDFTVKNPSLIGDDVRIIPKNDKIEITSIRVLSIDGKVLKAKNIFDDYISFSTSSFSAGVYILNIITNNKIYRKLIYLTN